MLFFIRETNLVMGQKYLVVSDYYLSNKECYQIIYNENDTNHIYFKLVSSKQKIQNAMELRAIKKLNFNPIIIKHILLFLNSTSASRA